MNKLLLLLGVAGLLLTAGCRKEDEVVCAPPAGNPLADFFRRNQPAEQVFALPDVSQTQTIRTAKGAKLIIRGGTLALLGTNTAATGAAVLRLREMYDVPDMLLADLPTQTNGGQFGSRELESGGEFQIQVWQGRQRLVSLGTPGSWQRMSMSSPYPRRRRTQPASFSYDTWFSQPLKPFNANLAADTSQTSPGWTFGQGFVLDTVVAPGQPQPMGYLSQFVLDSLSLHNIDWFVNLNGSSPRGDLQIIIPTADGGPVASAQNTRVYLVPYTGNTMLRLYYGTPTPLTWGYLGLPGGLAYAAVVLQCPAAGQLRFAVQFFTLAAGSNTLTVQPMPMSEADILAQIRAL